MKKRILSLLLALVTVFYILPIGVVPAIALDSTDEETGLSVSDMEVGKLYSAKWVSDTFWPYARFNFINTYDALGEVINEELLPESVTVIRNSVRDFNLVYTTNLDWPAGYDDYRYIDADKLLIDGGLSVDEMELGKEYTAVWNLGETETGLAPYRPAEPSESAIFEEYGYGDEDVEPEVSTKNFPEEVIVKRIHKDDTYVYATNVDWPMIYDQYRYIDPYYDLIITEEYVSPVSITYRGQETDIITLYEDGKMLLEAAKTERLTGDVEWGWEILVDAENNTWARIYDKVTDVCYVTYALVKNVLDENNKTKIRAVAYDGETEYRSLPITIKTVYAPKPMEPEYENITTANEEYIVHSAKAYADGDTSTERITLTVNFIKVRPDGTQVQATYPDIRTLKTDYEAYTVNIPSVLGYYPSMTEPSNPYDFSQNPDSDDSLTTVSIDAGYTADYTVNVYYYPGKAKYKIYHFIKNVYDDNYVAYEAQPVTEGSGTVDSPVSGCEIDITGFRHLYYEPTEIAADGSTVIEVRYDREYYTVLFDMVEDGAYGQENLYVPYGYEVGINDAICAGYGFVGWEVVDCDDPAAGYEYLTAGKENKVKIICNVTYKANWSEEIVNYNMVYWLENPNDGNYSIWHTVPKTATSGTYIKYDGDNPVPIDDVVTGDEDYQYTTLNTSLTYEEMVKDSPDGVVIKGDGSSTVNVFFNRRYYQITFVADTLKSGCKLDEHFHGDGTCEYNPFYCKHVHTSACNTSGSCSIEEHTHVAGCKNCSKTEHIHGPECCGVHVHDAGCYSVDSDMATSIGSAASPLVEADIKKNFSWGGDLISGILNTIVNDTASEKAAEAATAVQKEAPPQNLQNGYVYVLNDLAVPYSSRTGIISGTIYMDVPTIYINGQWYYYDAYDPDVDYSTNPVIIEADTCPENAPDHDHTGGCNSEVCTVGYEHTHTDAEGCYGCGKAEHEHTDYCLCTHEHTIDCYGYLCMKPEHQHTNDTTYSEVYNNLSDEQKAEAKPEDYYQTIRILQAKYGQDITAYVPYFIELNTLGLQQNDEGAYFTYWKYDSTGTDTSKAIDRYVKHITMVTELCYSAGIRTVAQYSSNIVPYILYYMFESFDIESGEIPYDENGNGRKEFDGKWYDADSTHMQFIALDATDSDGDGVIDALAQLEKEGIKSIHGMNIHTVTGTETNPEKTEGINVLDVENVTRYVYFYDRNSSNLKVNIFNAGNSLITIPQAGESNPLKYGASLGDFAAVLKSSETYGNFDINNVPYPSQLEVGAYVFAGWYTTEYQSEYTMVDWETDTLPDGELNLYAIWTPVTRHVKVYDDATFTTQFSEDNYGDQYVGHRYYAVEPDYTQSAYKKDLNYTFNGWFYVDPETNEEKAFLFNFPITQDMVIYAKWISEQTVNYKINFVTQQKDENGQLVVDENDEPVYVQIGNSMLGSALAGQNKTFRALAGADLYADYQEGYFPQVGSHTVQMKFEKDGDGNILVNEYNFVYDEVEEVSYWVKYVDNETREVFDSTDPNYPATYEGKTRKAAVTELFVPITGYTVDAYSKSLILSSTDQATNNVITFYYTKNEADAPITAPWVVNHLIQNVDGTYSVYSYQSGTFEIIQGGDGNIVFGTVLTDITGYSFSKADAETRRQDETSGVVESVVIPQGDLEHINMDEEKFGYTITEYGLEINLYYDRVTVGYTVKYVDVDSGEEYYSYEVAADASGVQHGHLVTVDLDKQKHMEIVNNKGCDLVDQSTQRSLTLYIDESRNVIIFYYQKSESTFIYEIVCDDIDGSDVGLSMTRENINSGSDDTPVGSIPYESETYYFAGWFKDAECTTPIDTNVDPVTIGEYSHLIPTKTQFTYEDDNGDEQEGNLYISATYYALFLPRSADLEIKITSGQSDSFILTFTGVAGTFAEGKTFTVAVVDGVALTVTDVAIGQYTVTFDKKWSWRYGNLDSVITTVDVEVSVGGSITIKKDDLTIATDQWLTDNEVGMVTP